MEIVFEVNGDVQLARNLRTSATKIPNMRGFFTDALDIMGERSDKIFDTQGSTVAKSPRWKNLAPSTQLAREKRWGYYKNPPKNPAIMVWTGNLKNSQTKKVTAASGIMEYTAPYAIYHQEGKKRLPKRAMIDLDNPTNDKMVKAMQQKIEDDLGVFGTQL